MEPVRRWRAVLILVLVMLAGLPVSAQNGKPDPKVKVIFRVDPTDAGVWHQYGFVGPANKPLLLDLEPFGEGQIELSFKREGYATQNVSVSARTTFGVAAATGRTYTYPVEGVIYLKPSSLEGHWQRNRWMFYASVPLLGLAGVGLWQYLRARKALKRVQQIDEMIATTEIAQVSPTLGGYRLVRELGGGGMARVYYAIPEETLDDSKAVAIKVLQAEMDHNEEYEARFQREVKVCLNLLHKNIVRLYDYGDKDGRKFLVMEYVDGETMAKLMRQKLLTPQEIYRICGPLFSAVSYAHAQGVVHRDLKPENIMITTRGDVKVLDFGLARSSHLDRVTLTGTALGTPAYMAPEQVRGGSVYEPASDQYALGLIVHEMITGQRAFNAEDPMQVLFMQISDTPQPPSELREGVPPEVDGVLARMLAKQPGDRFADVEEAGQALSLALRRWGKG
ncbi:serine/threonine protein kinase [bacterium CPR1]|nr:serine/threonine protein kinase [bacterium CPR1]